MDIFPSFPSKTGLQIVEHPETVPRFTEVKTTHSVDATIAYMVNDKLYFTPPKKKWDPGLTKHFRYVGKESLTFNPDFRPDSISWDAIRNKLTKEVHNQKNNNVRLCFCWNNNTFLVKASFTFGQRTVEAGTCHVYQMTTVPLLFYVLKPGRKTESATRRERSFNAFDQYAYKRYILEPQSQYVVPENTTYVIVAVQKTLFAVNIVKANSTLPFECRSPYETERLECEENPYKNEPKTPALDRLLLRNHQDDDDDEEEEEEQQPQQPEEATFLIPQNHDEQQQQQNVWVEQQNVWVETSQQQDDSPNDEAFSQISSVQPNEETFSQISCQTFSQISRVEEIISQISRVQNDFIPPSPPPPPSSPQILERNIQRPEFPKWVQSLKRQIYGDPLQVLQRPAAAAAAADEDEEPMDLTCKNSLEEQQQNENDSSVQPNDETFIQTSLVNHDHFPSQTSLVNHDHFVRQDFVSPQQNNDVQQNHENFVSPQQQNNYVQQNHENFVAPQQNHDHFVRPQQNHEDFVSPQQNNNVQQNHENFVAPQQQNNVQQNHENFVSQQNNVQQNQDDFTEIMASFCAMNNL